MNALYEACGGCGAETPPDTSGLEVVAWLTTGGDVTRSEAYAKEQSVNDPENYPTALVTAASAQAEREQYGRWLVAMANGRDAEKARADRLAKAVKVFKAALTDIAKATPDSAQAETAEDMAEWTHCRAIVALCDHSVAALQQETQP